MTKSTSPDARSPLEVATSVGERFMKIRHRNPDYMRGVGLSGILDLYEATRRQSYLDFYLSAHAAGKTHFNCRLFEITGDRAWIAGVEERAEKFLANPRRDREGALLDPRGRYTVDVLSGQFVEPIIYGHLLRDHRFFDEALRLLEIVRSYLEDPQTGVWYSRCGSSLHPDRPNPGLWARGNGWLVAAWGRAIHRWDPSHRGHATMIQAWQHYCKSLAAWQAPSGLFRQLLNRPDSFEEASGSGLFCDGLSHGVLSGTLPADLGGVAFRTFCGLRGLVDDEGNIHNTSTYAGGYNYERQYLSCARFNEPHGDGTVMGGCVALHWLQQKMTVDTAHPPTQRPVLVTTATPGLLCTEPPLYRPPDEVARPVLKRVLELDEIPIADPFGGTILGLLHWHDLTRDGKCLPHAEKLLERARGKLAEPVHWNLMAEIGLRRNPKTPPEGLPAFVDGEMRRVKRDRNGVMLDEFGGYSISHLCRWLPLLAKAGLIRGANSYFDEACAQLLRHQRWLEDPLTGFWRPAFGRGAHPRRVTPGLWALGNAWCLGAIADVLESLPQDHPRRVDVICLMRGLIDRFHEYLPVGLGWRQILDDLDSFPCNAASALITHASARALLNGWAKLEYHALVGGGLFHLSEMVNEQGDYEFMSKPEGGLDTIPAYGQHRLKNDPACLGSILSALACGTECLKPGMDTNQDGTLGAR